MNLCVSGFAPDFTSRSWKGNKLAKVLVTGAFGNVGSSTLNELLAQNHTVTAFDTQNRATERVARRYDGRISIIWGDLRNPNMVEKAVAGHDYVAHIGAVIPPASEANPELAEQVNVGGTRHILTAMEGQPTPPRLIYTSSFAIYGHQQHVPPPRRVGDPIMATDHYTSHKIACEKMIQESKLQWTILRCAAMQPMSIGNLEPLMFEVPLAQRIEFLHTYDAGLAIANAVSSSEVWGKILHLGGGERCQMLFRDYLGKALAAAGLPMPPESAFTTAQFHTDWLDTEESQRLLQYQRHTYEDFLDHLRRELGYRRYLGKLFGPLVIRRLLRQSPYYTIQN